MFDLSALNKEQKEAVQATEGAVLVLAGAGTGKTRVLTSRIAYIVSQQLCHINEILAVTFTNKAANEMKERAINLLNQAETFVYSGENLWIGTFHSLALRIIRPYYDLFNRSSNFTIVDASDQLRLLKKIATEYKIDDKGNTPKQIAYYINRWKDRCCDPEEAKKSAPKFTAEAMAANLYQPYQNMLASLDAIDFGDILKISIELFKKHQEILQKYQEKFKYIMVDEYQDTNTAQYIWLRLLAMGYGNLCCVGDDDQSIYSWRGADVGNILKFAQDFKNSTIIRLGQNYRSTKNIIKAASGLIANNSMRMKKKFWTEEEVGSPVIVKALMNPIEEARFISSLIINKHKNGLAFQDIAILVRATYLTRIFEERFLAEGIPYIVVGGMKFYERKEIKDAIAYLKLVVNPDDSIAFERIINLPKRGIGPASINKFYTLARDNDVSLPKAALEVANNAKSTTNTKLLQFFDQIDNWRREVATLAPADLMQKILNESGYIAMLKESKNLENETRLETLDELIKSLEEFDDIKEFLDYVSLVMDKINANNSDTLTISTIHAAKGLEFHTVFIPGFEENIMPHQKSILEKGELGIEEERRLCYVAITRAKREAYITFCNKRGAFGTSSTSSTSYTAPSRFLKDLPRSCIRVV